MEVAETEELEEMVTVTINSSRQQLYKITE